MSHLSNDVISGNDIKQELKSINHECFTNSLTLCNDGHHNLVYIWQYLSIFMPQKCAFKEVLVLYDK